MRIGGIFVGVDDQLDEAHFRSLTFAGDDAAALWAIFADFNDGASNADERDTLLLIGKDATRKGVEWALDELTRMSREERYELVVVHFSAHGTPTGELLFHDTMYGEEKSTGMELEELGRRVARIRTDNVLIILDSCFSGAAGGGARINAEANDNLVVRLRRVAGTNGAIVWSADANESAWESARLEHGFLTYAFVTGLDGTTLAHGGEVSVVDLVNFAVREAQRLAREEGAIQTPGLAVFWQGTTMLPAIPPGPRRRAQLERTHVHVVTPDVSSLAAYGLSAPVIEAVRTRIRGKPLSPMQVRAISSGGAMAGQNVLVSAPTSSGKTLVGELAALAAVARRRKTVFLLPTRALTNEKWSEFRDTFDPMGIRAVRSFGGVNDDDLAIIRNHYNVAFLTYEKFYGLALSRPRIVDGVGTVVLDEVHMLGDSTRGRVIELLLTMLRARQRTGRPVQIVALSAALGALNGFPEWLDAQLVREARSERPIPLREGVLSTTGVFRFVDSDTQDEGRATIFAPAITRVGGEKEDVFLGRAAAAAVSALLESDTRERILVFRAHKAQTRHLAERLAQTLVLETCNPPLSILESDGAARDDSRATRALIKCLQNGVGFHISDLEQAERDAIEAAFRSGKLRCLVATSGLAMGINMPASSVVVTDHERFDGSSMSMRPFGVSEYKNMAGRAGRWLDDKVIRGTSYLVAASDQEADDLFELYVKGTPEPLTSQLSGLSCDDLVLALLAIAGRALLPAELVDLAHHTFFGFQNASNDAWRSDLRVDIEDAITGLDSDGFVAQAVKAGQLTLTSLGHVCGSEGFAVSSARSVLRAADQLKAAGEEFDGLALVCIAQITQELGSVFMPVAPAELTKWGERVEPLLRERPALLRALNDDNARLHCANLKRVFAVIEWLLGKPIDAIEARMSNGRPADESVAGVIRSVASRTADIVRPVARLISLRYPDHAERLREVVLDLRPRLEVGVTRQSAELARSGLKLRRGELLHLSRAGIATVDKLRESLRDRLDAVLSIFGSSRAAAILEQTDGLSSASLKRAADGVQRDLFADIGPVRDL